MLKIDTVLHKKNVIMVLQKVLILLSIQLPPSIVTVHHVVGTCRYLSHASCPIVTFL